MGLMKRSRGQSLAEMALVLVLVIGAVSAMVTYVKRAYQANIQATADNMSAGLKANNLTVKTQYEPYYSRSDVTSTQDSSVNEAYQTGGGLARTSQREKMSRTGTSSVSSYNTADTIWK